MGNNISKENSKDFQAVEIEKGMNWIQTILYQQIKHLNNKNKLSNR